jgi:hypothetical protein
VRRASDPANQAATVAVGGVSIITFFVIRGLQEPVPARSEPTSVGASVGVEGVPVIALLSCARNAVATTSRAAHTDAA